MRCHRNALLIERVSRITASYIVEHVSAQDGPVGKKTIQHLLTRTWSRLSSFLESLGDIRRLPPSILQLLSRLFAHPKRRFKGSKDFDELSCHYKFSYCGSSCVFIVREPTAAKQRGTQETDSLVGLSCPILIICL